MLKVWGKIIKDTKIVIDDVATADTGESYQENLKICITELCNKLDIEKPYWLPTNLEEYNKRSKTSFNQDNFIEDINFDKFIIIELQPKDEET